MFQRIRTIIYKIFAAFVFILSSYQSKNIMNCDLCPPGQRVVQYCTEHFPTNCGACPPRTFAMSFNNDTTCIRCSDCKRKEILVSNCTSQADTVCTCPPGFRYNKQEPCRKCGEDEEVVGNVCRKFPTLGPVNKSNNKSTIIWSASIGVLILLVLVLVICLYIKRTKRRKREKKLEKNEIKPDLIEQSKLLDKRNIGANQYFPVPNKKNRIVYSPSEERLLNVPLSNKTNYDLICELNKELNTSGSWQDLAGKLGLSYRTILNLSNKSYPDALYGFLISEQKVTYKDLSNALEDMGKQTMAKKVLSILQNTSS